MIILGLLLSLSDATGAPSLRNATTAKFSPCRRSLANGQVFTGAYAPAEFSHSLTIKNGMRGPAWVRLRNVETQQASLMYVVPSSEGVFEYLPDGTYEVLFAYGGALSSDCFTIVDPDDVQKFSNPLNFETVETAEKISVRRASLTLYQVRKGNARSRKATAAEFNRK